MPSAHCRPKKGWVLVAVVLALAVLPLVAVSQVIARVSVSSAGGQTDAASSSPCISANGRFVAFASAASNLAAGDTDGAFDVFVRDRQTGTTELVSVGLEGQSLAENCDAPSLSANGRFVAFTWRAGPGDWGYWRVLVRDRQTGTTRLVDAPPGFFGFATCDPHLSADGRRVAFRYITFDESGFWWSLGLMVSDWETGSIVTQLYPLRTENSLWHPRLSGDGRVFAWIEDWYDWPQADLHVVDLATGLGTLLDGSCISPSLNADGRYLAHVKVDNVDFSAPNTIEVYEPQTGQTTQTGLVGGSPSLSGDGGLLAFGSLAADLVPGDTNGKEDVFVHDMLTGQTRRLSVDNTGGEANEDSRNPSISGDGRLVAFESAADNLVPGDTNGVEDVFVADVSHWPVYLRVAGTAGYETDGVEPDSGPPGTTFAFRVQYTDPTGAAPRVHRCDIYRNECGQWVLHKKMGLTQESGDLATGAVFAGASKLPVGYPYRYQFVFRPGTGAQVTWPAGASQDGPSLTGYPRVCWTGATGFETDGVEPNAGPPGAKFLFKVLYTDSAGSAPTLAELQVRRDSRIRYKRAMKPEGTASDSREGVAFRFLLPIAEAGAYEYRFRFRNATHGAVGDPTEWQPGPDVSDGSSGSAVTVTALSAVPTPAGAQVTFSLASAAKVTATVINVSGRPVRTIVADRPLEAGMQTLLWDRRADTGLAVPAGLYLVRLTTRTEEGGQSSAVATVRLR